jgi:undecaprenyl-diphosphatase
MSWWEGIVLAVVEGLTEFLPVSSTGHLILVERLLGIEMSEGVKSYTVMVQFGAIGSVLWVYRERFKWKSSKKKEWVSFYRRLVISFIPAGLLGLGLGWLIDQFMESPRTVCVSLIIGGMLMLFLDEQFGGGEEKSVKTDAVAWKIGWWQCWALIPGMSRSLATIAGGMYLNLTRKAAVEYSFWLGVPTLGAACGYKGWGMMMGKGGEVGWEWWGQVLLGNGVSFGVGLLALGLMTGWVSKHGFRLLGVYRVLLGITMLMIL